MLIFIINKNYCISIYFYLLEYRVIHDCIILFNPSITKVLDQGDLTKVGFV